MTYDGILAHILSLSVIAELNQDEKRKIEKQIHELMHEHPDVCSIGSIGQPNELGTFAMPYTTEIYITQSLKQLDTSTASSLSRDNMSEQEAEALGLGTQGAVVTGTTTRRSADASPAVDNRLAVKDVASEALQLDDFFGGGAAVGRNQKGFKQQHFPSNFLRLVLVLNQVEVDIVVVEVQEKENEVDNNNNFKKVEK